MKQLLQNAYDLLQTVSVEEEIKAALEEMISEVTEDAGLLEKAQQMYRDFYDREEPLGQEISENALDLQEGRICSAIFFARAVYLRQENCYDLPDKSVDFVAQMFRFLKANHAKSGHYALVGTNRYWGYAYTYPCIFQLGRLVFQMGRFSFGYTVYEADGQRYALASDTVREENGTVTGCPYAENGLDLGQQVVLHNPVCLLKRGDPALNIHVPGNAKLTDEVVEASFGYAADFFKRYFPEIDYKAYVCSSWLLNPGLSQFMGEKSNILQFQRRFHIPFRRFNDFSLFNNIFNRANPCPLEELVPENRFQREVLDYVKAGGKLYSGQGYILIEK